MASKKTVLNDDAAIYQKRENKSEKQKWKEMSGRERWAYFKQYYAKLCVIGAVLLSMGAWLLYSMFGPSVENAVYIAAINDYYNEDSVSKFQMDLSDYLKLDPKKEDIMIDDSYFIADGSSDAYVYTQRFAAYLYAGDIDIIIAEPEEFDSYIKEEYFLNLSEVLPLELYTALSDDFYWGTPEDAQVEAPYGIKLNNSSVYKELEGYAQDSIIGIVVNSKSKEDAVATVEYFFEK